MKELLLCVIVVAVVVVTTALAALSGVSVTSHASARWLGEKDADRLVRLDASRGQRGVHGLGPPPGRCASDCQRKGADAEGLARVQLRGGAREAEMLDADQRASVVANALERGRLERELNSVEEVVQSMSNIVRNMLMEDAPDMIPLDAEKVVGKRDLGIDAEPDIFQMGIFEDQVVPLGNRDSLSFINAVERFPRKPRIVEAPDFPPERENKQRYTSKKIDNYAHVKLVPVENPNIYSYFVASSNKTDSVNDTSKEKANNTVLLGISQEGGSTPTEKFKNESFADPVAPEISKVKGDTVPPEILKDEQESESPEPLGEGRGTPVPEQLKEELLKEEGDPEEAAERDEQLPFDGGTVLMHIVSGKAPRSLGSRDAVARGRAGDGGVKDAAAKTPTTQVRAARSRLHVVLCALAVLAVALLAAATPVVQRVVVTMWYPRSRDPACCSGEDGDEDDSGCGGGGPGAGGDDEMLMPPATIKRGWKRGGVWTQWRRAAAAGASATAVAVAGAHRARPRVSLSRLRAALVAAARSRLAHRSRCQLVRFTAAAPRLPPPHPAPATLVIGEGVLA